MDRVVDGKGISAGCFRSKILIFVRFQANSFAWISGRVCDMK